VKHVTPQWSRTNSVSSLQAAITGAEWETHVNERFVPGQPKSSGRRAQRLSSPVKTSSTIPERDECAVG
jgi:hypothetical protein